jgi:hypothetical protein
LCFVNIEDQKSSQGESEDSGDESDDYEGNEDELLFSKRATMFYLEDENQCQVRTLLKQIIS